MLPGDLRWHLLSPWRLNEVQFEWATMLFWRACASRIIGLETRGRPEGGGRCQGSRTPWGGLDNGISERLFIEKYMLGITFSGFQCNDFFCELPEIDWNELMGIAVHKPLNCDFTILNLSWPYLDVVELVYAVATISPGSQVDVSNQWSLKPTSGARARSCTLQCHQMTGNPGTQRRLWRECGSKPTPDASCCWTICLHLPQKSPNVGEYSRHWASGNSKLLNSCRSGKFGEHLHPLVNGTVGGRIYIPGIGSDLYLFKWTIDLSWDINIPYTCSCICRHINVIHDRTSMSFCFCDMQIWEMKNSPHTVASFGIRAGGQRTNAVLTLCSWLTRLWKIIILMGKPSMFKSLYVYQRVLEKKRVHYCETIATQYETSNTCFNLSHIIPSSY